MICQRQEPNIVEYGMTAAICKGADLELQRR